MKLLGDMCRNSSIFIGICRLLFVIAVTFHIAISNILEFLFLHMSSRIDVVKRHFII